MAGHRQTLPFRNHSRAAQAPRQTGRNRCNYSRSDGIVNNRRASVETPARLAPLPGGATHGHLDPPRRTPRRTRWADITFRAGDDWCAGWLYRPEGFEGPRPLMVMGHGFSATPGLRPPAYAERFCAAGIGVLLFDYRHFGANGGKPRQLLDISRQHAAFRRALAYASGLDWVDPERVGLFGSSFAGAHVLAVGAADERVAAIVSQCPFTDGLATLPALGLNTIMKATVAGLRDQVTALRRGAPYYIPAAAPPGSL